MIYQNEYVRARVFWLWHIDIYLIGLEWMWTPITGNHFTSQVVSIISVQAWLSIDVSLVPSAPSIGWLRLKAEFSAFNLNHFNHWIKKILKKGIQIFRIMLFVGWPTNILFFLSSHVWLECLNESFNVLKHWKL